MSTIPLQIIILNATRIEAAPLIAALMRPRICTDYKTKVWTGLLDGISVAVAYSGIGMCKTRIALQDVDELNAGIPILNVGIAGALAASCVPGGWYEAVEILHENSRMEPMTAVATGRFPLIRLLTVESPVADRNTADRLFLEHSTELVDMEGYAVAEHVDNHGAGCHILKMVSDMADCNAHADFSKLLETYSASCLENTLSMVHAIIE